MKTKAKKAGATKYKKAPDAPKRFKVSLVSALFLDRGACLFDGGLARDRPLQANILCSSGENAETKDALGDCVKFAIAA